MKDISTVALRVAKELGLTFCHRWGTCEQTVGNKTFEHFAHRLLAELAKDAEPERCQVASSFCRCKEVNLYLHPAIPAPLPEGCMFAVTKGGHSICQPPKSFYHKGSAPLPDEVREMVERLRGENTWFSNHILGTEAADMIERLAVAPKVKP